MKQLRKNRAIAGRRNRCHPLGPIFQPVTVSFMYDQARQESLKKALEKYLSGSSAMLISDPEIKIIYPNRKKPRFIDASDYGQLVARVIMLETEVKRLQKDSHPPIDLTEAILDILRTANAIK